jgi:hypothetical protein
MWTLQEICIAGHATFHLGVHSLRWEALSTGLFLYTQIMPMVLSKDIGTWIGIEFVHEFRTQKQRNLSLSSLLHASQQRGASEPRDKSMLFWDCCPPRVYPSLEKISYRRSVASLYAEVSRLCWDSDRAKNMLDQASWMTRDRKPAELQLPSWSVAWSASRNGYFQFPLVSTAEAGGWKFNPRSRFSVTSFTESAFAKELKLRAFSILFAQLFKVNEDGDLHLENFPRCMNILKKCNKKSATLQLRPASSGNVQEAVRLDSEDISSTSQTPVVVIKILELVKDHESSKFTCAHPKTLLATLLKNSWLKTKDHIGKPPTSAFFWDSPS